MSWTVRIEILGEKNVEIFDVAEDDERLVTSYGAGQPQEYANTVEKVGEQIWKKVHDKGAYMQVRRGNSVVIPAAKIVKIEVSKE